MTILHCPPPTKNVEATFRRPKSFLHSIPPGAYFLTDEKVGKESPRNFRMFLGLFRRPKRKADWIIFFQHSLRFPLRYPLDGLCVSSL